MTMEKTNFFTLPIYKMRPYEYNDSVHYMIRYEMNRELRIGNRRVYGAFDMLGDVGGFAKGLFWLAFGSLFFFRQNIF